MSTVVSVIIPARNSATTLPATLESCLGQSHADLDIVVVDDSSTDDTFEIASSFPDARIRCFRGQGRGASAARNFGLRQSIGESVQFLDSDDILSENKIAQQLRVLSAYPGHVAICPWSMFSDAPHDGTTWPNSLFRDMGRIEYVQEIFASPRWIEHTVQTGCWLAPSTIIQAAGPWDESLENSQDIEFFMRVVMQSQGIRFVDDARLYWRNQPNSLGKQESLVHVFSRMAALDKMIGLARFSDVPGISREVLAGCYGDILIRYYPHSRPLERALMQRIERLGAFPSMGGEFADRLCRIVGWRAVRRAQLLKRTLWSDWRLRVPWG